MINDLGYRIYRMYDIKMLNHIVILLLYGLKFYIIYPISFKISHSTYQQVILVSSPATVELITLPRTSQLHYLGLPSSIPGTAKLFTRDCQAFHLDLPSCSLGMPSCSRGTAKLFTWDCQSVHLGLPSFSPVTAKLFT